MPSITVRGIPDELYDELKRAAEASHRSLNGEILARLEETFQARSIPVEDELRQLEKLHERIGWVGLTNEEIDRAKRTGRM
ncbi:MAG: Arc family DNA-binding protein [Gemmatimonadetes bacterium]|nr:Arc family DNA-binding protein [Gemmatimonadota bacterium]